MTIKLGNVYRDKVTGLHGICTGKAEYLYRDAAYCIEPGPDTTGRPVESIWIDEGRMIEVQAQAGGANPVAGFFTGKQPE